jgi:hypothetical protein
MCPEWHISMCHVNIGTVEPREGFMLQSSARAPYVAFLMPSTTAPFAVFVAALGRPRCRS